jgi:hypothetical protein
MINAMKGGVKTEITTSINPDLTKFTKNMLKVRAKTSSTR